MKIHVINRAQIIDDAINLARSGLLSYEIALGVTSYLNKEVEYIPWAAALSGKFKQCVPGRPGGPSKSGGPGGLGLGRSGGPSGPESLGGSGRSGLQNCSWSHVLLEQRG
jgi:hypothetical protein